MCFSQGSIPESFIKNQSYSTFVDTMYFILWRSSNFQQMLNNFTNSECFLIKLSGIEPYKKRISILGEHA